MDCYNCKKDCNPQQYRMKVIDKKGKESFQDCCSVKCCDEVKERYINIHIDRVTKMNKERYRVTCQSLYSGRA